MSVQERPPVGALGRPASGQGGDEGWTMIVPEGGAHLADGVAESLLCLADGTFGARATLEEDEAALDEAMLVGGCYRPAAGVGEDLRPLPGWWDLPLPRDFPPGERLLDLRDGTLWRNSGHGLLRSLRFACAARPGVGVLVAWVHPALLRSRAVVPPAGTSSVGGGIERAAWSMTALAGSSSLRVERIVAHARGDGHRGATGTAAQRLTRARAAGSRGLLAEQRQTWVRRWQDCDIEVTGDLAATRALRFAMFHLQSSAPDRGVAAVGARGLTGSAYAGHVLWDTDVFVLPFLAAARPEAARAVLQYRIARLGPARRRAAEQGAAGLRFPWESATTGEEVTPTTGRDQNGDEIPITTGRLEEHVTADVAWSAWRYATWTGRWSFLREAGRPLIVDTARYWASRVRWDETGGAHIGPVTGPDEYHEAVEDNAFTNLMARWNLRRAVDLVEWFGPVGREVHEVDGWRATAKALVDGRRAGGGGYEQFRGYDALAPLTATDLGGAPVSADLLVGHDRLVQTGIVKQADVLMAHLLIPDEMEAGSLAADMDRYLPRTVHGSPLSPAVHAGLLARLGRSGEALDLLRMAASVDADNLTETTAGGLHLANLGGMWQAVLHGFAGVRGAPGDADRLRVEPILPAEWHRLRLRFLWRGRRVQLTIGHDEVGVRTDRAMAVEVAGDRRTVVGEGRFRVG